MKPKIYLDYAAATPLDPKVEKAMQPFASEEFANPSALYAAARQTRQALEAARADVAKVLGAKKTEIVFTAGGTESVNLAILGVARSFPGSRVLAAATEHEAGLACLRALEAEGHATALVPAKPDGLIDPGELTNRIDDQTVLVTIAYANSEIGVIQPLAKLAAGISEARRDRQARGIDLPLYLHTDAAQAAGALDLHVSRLRVDLMSLNGGKVYGPKQAGVLYVRAGVELRPLVYGGGQERGLRAGTENVANAVGLAKALELAQENREPESKRLRDLHEAFINKVLADIPGTRLNGHPTKRLPGNINLSFDGVSGQDLVLYLDAAGIMSATGSACSAAKPEPSAVLLALGLDHDTANASLRLTLGRGTTAAQLERTAGELKRIVTQLRGLDAATTAAKIGE